MGVRYCPSSFSSEKESARNWPKVSLSRIQLAGAPHLAQRLAGAVLLEAAHQLGGQLRLALLQPERVGGGVQLVGQGLRQAGAQSLRDQLAQGQGSVLAGGHRGRSEPRLAAVHQGHVGEEQLGDLIEALVPR